MTWLKDMFVHCKIIYSPTGSAVVRRIGDFGSPTNDASPEKKVIRGHSWESYFFSGTVAVGTALSHRGLLCRDKKLVHLAPCRH